MVSVGQSWSPRAMRPLVGLSLGGGCIREARGARLGEPIWGPDELLRDLELRLGIPESAKSSRAALPKWAARIAELGPAFYSASFALDPLGTTEAVLAWRDALLDGGWDGQPIGSERIDALARIPIVEARIADRLVRVESTLDAPLYDEIVLADEEALWPLRWRRVFARAATRLSHHEVVLPGAAFGSDLEILQQAIREGTTLRTVRGDGSLLLVRAETPSDLGAFAASELANRKDAVVIRCLDPMPLETALAAHGLPTAGTSGDSEWRPAMQVLPLALELAFEPRDPNRLLELLTLPIGPFQGVLGARLARAVARQPGVGGQEWNRQRADVARYLADREAKRLREEENEVEERATKRGEAYAAERMTRVAEWLEVPGASKSAPRDALLAVTERVSNWLQKRGYATALAQATELEAALRIDPRTELSRDETRQLFDVVARTSTREELSPTLAGHTSAIHRAGALLASCATLFVWAFVSASERPPSRLPWSAAEREALARAGIVLVDPAIELEAESRAWRRAILSARERVIFALPATMQGVAMSPHSFWDEICGRLGLHDDQATLCITRDTRDLYDHSLDALALPEALASWDVTLPSIEDVRLHATALETLVTCPLRFVLEERAQIEPGAVRPLAKGALLRGGITHRLVEELHAGGAFALDEHAFLHQLDVLLLPLVAREAATLLLDGAAFERTQALDQIRRGVRSLHRWLVAKKLRIAAVEEDIEIDSSLGPLFGRIDLRLENERGDTIILDLKWGASSHFERLRRGRAIQLAVYVRAFRREETPPAPAAYFAVSRRRVLSVDSALADGEPIDGPSLQETWARVERTAAVVQRALSEGRAPAIGTRRALPLLEALGVHARDGHYEADKTKACEYCNYPALCGRSWEAYA